MGRKGNLFSHPSLKEFFVDEALIRFRDEDITALDAEVIVYESASPNDIRQALINRNEIMSSYAISQAEKSSSITPKMAGEIRTHYDIDPHLAFRVDANGIKEIEQNFDRQEFLNILKTFRWVSANGIKYKDISLGLLSDIHRRLTFQMDDFRKKFFDVLPEMTAQSKSEEGKFHWYHPGEYRSDDATIVGTYKPVGHEDVKGALEDAIKFYKKEPSLINLNIFTAVLYAIHPFSNGNKRLCRIIEHALMRDLGLNRRNIYGHSYYFYRELDRFYENLSRSLETRNLCPIVNFSREGIFFSMLLVYEEGIKNRRRMFLEGTKKRYGDKTKVLARLVGRKEASFGELQKSSARSLTKRSLINYLNMFLAEGIVEKRKMGRETYYSLKLDLSEEKRIKEHLQQSQDKLHYIPRSLTDAVYQTESSSAWPLHSSASFGRTDEKSD